MLTPRCLAELGTTLNAISSLRMMRGFVLNRYHDFGAGGSDHRPCCLRDSREIEHFHRVWRGHHHEHRLCLLTRMMHLLSANCVVSNTKWRLVMFATLAVASAQEATKSGMLIQEVTITGSRVPRADLKSNSPVTVVDAEELKRSQSLEIERALSSLPQVAGTVGATFNLVTGSGIATAGLQEISGPRGPWF